MRMIEGANSMKIEHAPVTGKAFGREVPDAEIHLLNAGHFALDEEADAVAMLIRRFLQPLLG